MRILSISDNSETPKNAIASMVDIAFLLLIFFLVATTIRPTERDLPMTLPTPGSNSPFEADPVLVTLDQDGSVRWGEGDGQMLIASSGAAENLEVLGELLEVSVAAWGVRQPGVILKVADEVDQQRFIDVLDRFAASGVVNVGLSD